MVIKLIAGSFIALIASAHAETPNRYAFFQKVGIIQRAANACGDDELKQAALAVMGTPEVQNVKSNDWMAAEAIIKGVSSFNRRVEEQGLQFNCELVKVLAREDGYLK